MNLSSVYGLILSSELPIPGLRAVPSGAADVHILLRKLPGSRSPVNTIYQSDSLTVHRSPDESFLFQYSDGATFVLDSHDGRVWADWAEPFTLEDATTYLLGPILGFLLRLRGVLCLHASAIRINDHAVAFAGGNGTGKSTLAARFADRGYRILSDDLLPLRNIGDRIFALPGYPRLRLWPDATILYGNGCDLPALTPNWDKRYLDLDGRFQEKALPLAAIYVLGDRVAGADVPAIRELSATEACWALLSNTYANYLLDRSQRAAEFDSVAALVNRVPVRTVIPGSGRDAIDRLCSLVTSSCLR